MLLSAAALPSRLLRRVGWMTRNASGARPESVQEALWRLRRQAAAATNGAHRAFPLPFGMVHYTDPVALAAQVQEIFWEKCYDFTSDRPNPRIVDCGGNLGLSVIRFRQLYPEARITVFEADPELAGLLRQNLAEVGDTKTEVNEAAIWIKDGSITFDRLGSDAGRISDSGGATIPCHDIAKFCQEPVDLLKIDIEGAEYPLIAHLRDQGLLRNVRRIVAELHDYGQPGGEQFHQFLMPLVDAGMRYHFTYAGSSGLLNDADSGSGFPAVRYRGANAVIYAWHDDQSA